MTILSPDANSQRIAEAIATCLIDAIEKRLIPIKNNRDSQALIRGFIGRNRYKKIIDLDAC